MQDIYHQETDQILSATKEIYYGTTYVLKKYHHYMYLKMKDVTKGSLYSTKINYILLKHFLDKYIFGIKPSHVNLKIATMLYS